MSPDAAELISRARVERALHLLAMIVTETGGEVYLPIFERLERELAKIDSKADALARARKMITANPKPSPSTRHGA